MDGVNRSSPFTRRTFLQVGSLGLSGFSWPEWLASRAGASPGRTPAARTVIQLFMWGGPSQLETFDLKPNAPAGIRGPFQSIATATPGIRICEHLPRLALRTPLYAITRSLTHNGVNHGTSAYHMLTGHVHFTPGTLRHPTPNDFPSIGCAVGRYGPTRAEVPSYVALPSVLLDGDGGEVPGQGPGFLGQRQAPFLVQADPNAADFSPRTIGLDVHLGERLGSRRSLQATLDGHRASLARLPGPNDMSSHYERAYRLLASPGVRQAFDLNAEPAGRRDRYGRNTFGQSCLLARRLAEEGVPMITVYWNAPDNGHILSWDTHTNSFERLSRALLPRFDLAMSALLEDLHDRGLLDQTLVTWHGEFGRTPRINGAGGRDHWGFCQSLVVAGGGVRGGLVHGSSDAHAAYAAENPVSPDDLAATIFDRLGIDLDQELRDAQGRPLPFCTGRPVTNWF